MASKQVSGIW